MFATLQSKRYSERHCFGALYFFAVLFLTLEVSITPATAIEIPPEALLAFKRADESERIRFLIQLAKSGDHELARTLLEKQVLEGEHAANRTLYIEGLILKGEGKPVLAIDKFRAALASDPSLTLVRSDLIEALVEIEQDDAAKHHLRLLESEAPDETTASGIRSFIEQINARRPYTINAYVSAAPTTNINNGTRNRKVYSPFLRQTFEIDPDSREKDAFGLSFGVNGSFSKRLSEDYRFIASGNIETRIYDNFDYNALGASQAAELRHIFDRGYISLGFISSQDLSSDDLDLSHVSYGPRFAAEVAIDHQNRFNGTATYEWHDFQGSSESDNAVFSIDGSLTHAFNSTFTTSVSAGYANTQAVLDTLSFDTWSGGMTLYKEVSNGLTFDVGGELRFSKFDELNVAAAVTREDIKFIGTVALTKRDLSFLGIAPSLQYTFIFNDSNIAVFDFDSHSLDLKFTKSF